MSVSKKDKKLKKVILFSLLFIIIASLFFGLLKVNFVLAQDVELVADEQPPADTGVLTGVIAANFQSAMTWLADTVRLLGGQLLEAVMNLITKVSSYNNFIGQDSVRLGWVTIRDMVNMFFILGLLVIAFATVLKIEKYGYNRLLGRLLLMAILVNFSRTICGLIIDAFQVLMLSWVNGYKDQLNNVFTAGFKVDSGLQYSTCNTTVEAQATPSATEGLTAFATAILGIIYIIVSLIIMAIFLMLLVFRIVALWILIIFSPLAFFAWSFEGAGKLGEISSRWWKMFFEYCMVGPFLAFFLWFSVTTVNQVGTISQEMSQNADPCQWAAGASKAGEPQSLLGYIISILILVAGLKFTGEFKVAGAGAASGAADWMKKQTAGRVENYARRAGSYVAEAPGRAVKGAVGLGVAGAGAVGGFAYKQYVKPRVTGVREDLSKAWQTKTSLGDFGKKVYGGYRKRLSESEAPTLKAIGEAMGGKLPQLPKGIKAKGKALARLAVGDARALANTLINETSLSGELNDHIRRKTQAQAGAIISKDEKPIRAEDARYEDKLLDKLGIDKANQDQVNDVFKQLTYDRKGKKITSEPLKRLTSALHRQQGELGVSDEYGHTELRKLGVFDGQGDLYRRIYADGVEQSEKKSRGRDSAISGDFYNAETKKREDYTGTMKNLEHADDELTSRTGWAWKKEDRVRKSIDFNGLRTKDAAGNYQLDMGKVAAKINDKNTTADQKALLEKVRDINLDTNMNKNEKAALLHGGLAMSSEFEQKRAQEMEASIKMGGEKAVIETASDRNFVNPWKYGPETVIAAINGTSANRQWLGKMAKEPRDIAALKLDFWHMQDLKDEAGNIITPKAERRIELLQQNPEKLADLIEGLEGEEAVNAAATNREPKSFDQLGASDLQNSVYIQDVDTRTDKANVKEAENKQKAYESLTAKYDAQGKLEEPGKISEEIQNHLEDVRKREGVDVKLKQAIDSATAGNDHGKVDAAFVGINEQIDAIVQSAKDQQTRTAAIAKLIGNQLQKVGIALAAPQTNKLAAALEENTEGIKKRIKVMDTGFEGSAEKIKNFVDTLNSYAASGTAPSGDDLATLNILKETIINGIKKYAKNNALDESKFKVSEVEAHLNQMLGTEPDANKEVNINSFISTMTSLLAQKKAATSAKVIKDINTQISKLNDAWKGIYGDLQDFGFKT